MHCPTARGQRAVLFLQRIASRPGGTGRCNPCNTLPQCLGAMGTGTPATHHLTALGPWAVELLQCTVSLPGGSGQWSSCNAPPQCLASHIINPTEFSVMLCTQCW